MTDFSPSDEQPERNELRELSPKERLDAILESKHLTTEQAVQAMNATFEENQATFPHAVILSVPISSEPEGPNDSIYRKYVGPFRNKAAAIAWAEPTVFTAETATFEVVRIDSPERYDADVRALRRVIGGEDPDEVLGSDG
jgi:hypothetical protein